MHNSHNTPTLQTHNPQHGSLTDRGLDEHGSLVTHLPDNVEWVDGLIGLHQTHCCLHCYQHTGPTNARTSKTDSLSQYTRLQLLLLLLFCCCCYCYCYYYYYTHQTHCHVHCYQHTGPTNTHTLPPHNHTLIILFLNIMQYYFPYS